ncbi:serine/threonine-protein kinase [Streptomyces sp. NPDC059534]|uniref:serine/threonine-protein kinase n=1 Tax=Streptomyces sp. NPDC059534 TaxID=3346859 RepID=UPI0036B160D3
MSSGENGRLAGRYRIVRQLGRGGMGVVWRAVDDVLGREVAVKELRTYSDAAAPELADLRLRMTREARAAARVRHPGVVAVHDVTEHDGRPVIVMELVDGPSLDDVLGERGTLDAVEAARIGARVLEALAAAHDVGVLHRDVKPGNILLDRSGRIVLTDFGIATMEDPGDGSATHLTRSGEIVGSLDFLAPERARGQDPGPASDVWALGATLYAAVEGASPFRRTSTWSTLAAIVTEPLPDPRRAGPLTPVLLRLLDKDPASRPTAREAALLLDAVAGTEPASGAAAYGTHGGASPDGPSDGPASGAVAAGVDAGPGAADAAGPAAGFGGAYGASAEPYATPGGPYAAPAEPYRGGGAVQPPERGAAPLGGGFGPAVPVPMAGPASAPVPGPTGDPGTGGRAETRAARRAGAGPRRGTALVAASVAAVLLAGGGITYALMDHGAGDRAAGDTAQDGGQGAAAGGDPGRVLDPGTSSAPPSGQPSGTASPSAGTKPGAPSASGPVPGGNAAGGDGAGGADAGGAADAAGGGSGTRPPSGGGGTTAPGKPGGAVPTGDTNTAGGPSGGGGATSAPTTQAPAPAEGCTASGSSATCQVVRGATTTRYDGGEMGTVGAGPHTFSCQVDLDRTESYGGRTSRWFARTDDDSGNTNVYLSVLHLSGGAGGGAVAGLRVC